MFVVFVFFVAVVQPSWSTNASEARTLAFMESFLAGHAQIPSINTIIQLPDSRAVVWIEHGLVLCIEIDELRLSCLRGVMR
jgi:hypothetical protein